MQKKEAVIVATATTKYVSKSNNRYVPRSGKKKK
jgi:hypothetical protein